MDMIYASLQPLVGLTNAFLDNVVQPNTLDYLTAQGLNMSTPAAFSTSLQENWTIFLQYFLGFFVIACIGVFIAIVLPITGICICCCRGCGHSSEPKEDCCMTSSNKKEKVACELTLFFLGAIILAGGICSLFANQLLRNQTASASSGGAVYSISSDMGNVQAFFAGTSNEAKQAFETSVTAPTSRIKNALETLAEQAWVYASDISGAAESMATLTSMVGQLDSLCQSLIICDNSTKELRAGLVSLDTDLGSLRSSIKNDVSLCSATTPMCAQILSEIDNLKTCADYQGTDAEVAMVALVYALQSNITGSVNEGKIALETGFLIFNNTLFPFTQPIVQDIDKLYTDSKSDFDAVTGQLDDVDVTPLQDTFTSARPYVNDYGMAFYILFIISGTLIILIVLSFYFGMALGICKSQKNGNSGCSLAGISRALLLLGNGMAFVFGWIMLIMVTVYFVGGGVLHTEACRNLQVKEQTSASVIIDQLASNALRMPLNLFNTSKACESNVSIYNALQLDSQLNSLGNIPDSVSHNLKTLLGQLEGVTLVSETSTILTPKANETLHLLPAGLATFNTTAYKIENAKPFTCMDLGDLAVRLESTAAGLINAPLADNLRSHAASLRQIQSSTIADLTSERRKVEQSLVTVEKFEAMPDVPAIISDLTAAQNVLNTNGTTLVKTYISNVASTTYADISNSMTIFGSALKNDVGRCRPIYDVMTSTVNTVCYNVVDLVNVIWLTQGWALVFTLPSIIIAYRIIVLHKRMTSNAVADAMTMNILSDHK